MTTTATGIELLRALHQVEDMHRDGVQIEAAVSLAAQTHGVDPYRLAALLWEKLDACAEARAEITRGGDV